MASEVIIIINRKRYLTTMPEIVEHIAEVVKENKEALRSLQEQVQGQDDEGRNVRQLQGGLKMASENETVAKVIDDFAYLITLGNIGPNVATDIRNRIEAAHKREVSELRKCLIEAVDAACPRVKCADNACFLLQHSRENECKVYHWRKVLEGAKDDA